MKNIKLVDDYNNIALFKKDMFLYAYTAKAFNRDCVLNIYLASKSEPVKVRLQYKSFETVEEILEELNNI